MDSAETDGRSVAAASKEDAAIRLPTAAAASLALWVFLLAFGGGCLALYYARIRYVPEITWEESLTYLGALSIIGGCLVVLFGLLAFLPGVIWAEFLIGDASLEGALSYQRADRQLEPCLRRVAWRLGVSFLILMIAAHIVLCKQLPSWLSLVGIVPTSLFFIWTLREDLRFPEPSQWWRRWLWSIWFAGLPDEAPARARDSLGSRTTKYLAAYLVSGSLGLAALWFTSKVMSGNGMNLELGTLCTVVVVVANLLVAVLYRAHRPGAILVAALAALVLLAGGELIEDKASLVSRVMAHFGVGRDVQVSLIVKHEAFDLLRKQHVPVDAGPSDLIGRVDGVCMLSRLGKDYFLLYDKQSFSLPKGMVVSWSKPLDSADSTPDPCRPRRNGVGLVARSPTGAP
jgi:hypothetical protein